MTFEDASPNLISNIVWDCPAGEIYSFSGSEPVYNYNNIEGFLAPGNGNISVDPLFRDPDSADFHLMATYCSDPFDSPCIDAGDPDILDYILDCNFGLGGTRSDMGAYGGDNLGYPTEIFEQEPIIPESVELLQNYPNPFNAQTAIRFILPESRNVTLTVYDILGRRINTLIDQYLPAGNHSVTFDASDLSSGVYFARLDSNNATETIRMLLIR